MEVTEIFLLFQFLKVDTYYVENLSLDWLLLGNPLAFFATSSLFFFPFINEPQALYVVGKHVIFIFFFFFT